MKDHLTLWHNRRDTLLRVVDGRRPDPELATAADNEPVAPIEGPAPYYSVFIPIGISPGILPRHNITVEYSFDLPYPAEAGDDVQAYKTAHDAEQTVLRIGLDQQNTRGSIRRVTADLLAHLRYLDPHSPDPSRLRPYLEIERVFKAFPEGRRPAYYEAVLRFIPAGAKLRYRIKVYQQSRQATALPPVPADTAFSPDSAAGPDSDWHTLYVLAPEFTREHIHYCPPQASAVDINVVYWTEASAGEGKDQRDLISFRFDFVDVRRAINDFELALAPNDGSGAAPSVNRLTFAWIVDKPRFDLARRARKISCDWPLDLLPIVHEQFDFVTLTIPRDLLPNGASVIWRQQTIAMMEGESLKPAQQPTINPVRLLFMHYGNQSLNDYFESPNKSYSPPRTYLQTTMHDELGTFSSRPNANEGGIGDGYRFVFEQHQKNGLPGVFAVNGGFLTMLAQDDPEQFKWIKDGISAGHFEPAIGGWAGHRMLYFQEQTNRAALQYGIDVMENLLDGTSRAFHPNSRLYAATSNIDDAIAAARITKPLVRIEDSGALKALDAAEFPVNVQFVVIDQSAFRARTNNENAHDTPPTRNGRELWDGRKHCYLWRQPCPSHPDADGQCLRDCRSWYWLFIDSKMKDELFGASEEEWRAGKLFWQLRYHFFYGVSQPDLAKDSLLIYGDDLDKAAANGWFDGDYNGQESNNAAIFAAALEWIAAHPWLDVVTTADLNPETEYVGAIEIRDAIDPSIHDDEDRDQETGEPLLQPHWADVQPRPGEPGFAFPAWATAQRKRLRGGNDSNDLGFEYARWYLEWRETRSPWLNRTLGELSEELEERLTAPVPNGDQYELRRLAQLAYLMALHEAHWSKKPLESHIPQTEFEAKGFNGEWRKAFKRSEVLEPENFVLALSLQARNANVFWYADIWAGLRRPSGSLSAEIGPVTRRNDGPLIEQIRELNGHAREAPAAGQPDPGLFWDLDVTPNVILYNDQLLVVMDQNGGRITHIFALAADGRPVVISGNIKSYQFLGDDRQFGGQLPCNGSVLQNTVFTPNHQYVASDVQQSRPTVGKRYNPRTKIETRRRTNGSARVADGTFGNEDWLYPDNFNHYARVANDDPGAVSWTYPGLAWQVDGLESVRFNTALLEYRNWLLSNEATPRTHEAPRDGGQFTKTITLDGNTIRVDYSGSLQTGHFVANEFSLDLYGMMMRGRRQQRQWFRCGARDRELIEYTDSPKQANGIVACELFIENDDENGCPTVTLQLDEHCQFSNDTLEASGNARLHRAFSDCLEVEATSNQQFSYSIVVA